MIVDSAYYEDGVPQQENLSIEEAGERARAGHGFVWLALADVSTAELESLRTAFALPGLAVEDAHEGHQRPKLERYPENAFLVLKTARFDDPAKRIAVSELEVFLGSGYAIATSRGDGSVFAGVRERMSRFREITALGPMAAAWALTDTVVDAFDPVLDRLADDLEATEQAVFQEALDRGEEIYRQRRDATHLVRAIDPLIGVLSGLQNESSELPEPLRALFRDVSDHAHRLNGEVTVLGDALDALLNANLTRVTVRQNQVVQKVSGWAAILAVPTIITGIYGMNFRHVPEFRWEIGYPLVLVVMLVAVIGLRRYFKHVGWL